MNADEYAKYRMRRFRKMIEEETTKTLKVEMVVGLDECIRFIDGIEYSHCIGCSIDLPTEACFWTSGEDSEPMCGKCSAEFVEYAMKEEVKNAL